MIQLDKVKIGQVIKTLYSPEWAEKNNLIGNLRIKADVDSYLTASVITREGIFAMKSNYYYAISTFSDSYDIEMSDINLIPIEKIRAVIIRTFK